MTALEREESLCLADYHLKVSDFADRPEPHYIASLYRWRENEWVAVGMFDLRPDELGKLSRIFQAHEASYGRTLPARIPQTT